MVAQATKDAIRGRQSGKQVGAVGHHAGLTVAVKEISRDHDEIGLLGTQHGNGLLHPLHRDVAGEVDIADLADSVPVKGRGQVLNRNGDPDKFKPLWLNESCVDQAAAHQTAEPPPQAFAAAETARRGRVGHGANLLTLRQLGTFTKKVRPNVQCD